MWTINTRIVSNKVANRSLNTTSFYLRFYLHCVHHQLLTSFLCQRFVLCPHSPLSSVLCLSFPWMLHVLHHVDFGQLPLFLHVQIIGVFVEGLLSSRVLWIPNYSLCFLLSHCPTFWCILKNRLYHRLVYFYVGFLCLFFATPDPVDHSRSFEVCPILFCMSVLPYLSHLVWDSTYKSSLKRLVILL